MKQDIVNQNNGVTPAADVDETTPLLAPTRRDPHYESFPEGVDDEGKWTPPPGFWWIETGTIRHTKPPFYLKTRTLTPTSPSLVGQHLPVRL